MLDDLRFGLRVLAKRPGSTIIAILALALAIGLNTAIFSVLNAALLKSLPVQSPDELVMFTDPNASLALGGRLSGERTLLTYAEFVHLRDRTKTMSGICASQMQLQRWPVQIAGGSKEEARGRIVSENYFSVLGVAPALGRFFTQQDAKGVGTDPYLVISYDYWQRRFAGNPAILGSRVRLQHGAFVVIGVAPDGFHGETVGQDPDVWLPMLMQAALVPGLDALSDFMDSQSRDKFMWLHAFGRRKSGFTTAQVQAEVNVLFRRILEADYPASMESRKEALNQYIVLKPVRSGAFHGRNEFSEQWNILFSLAVLILLIACANVANLLLARAAERSQEVAIRLSMGAAKGRLVRQFLTESLLLAALGGIVGLVIAAGALRALLLALAHADDSIRITASIDPRVLGFTAAVTLVTGVLFGLAPAFRSARTSLNQTLKETGRGSTGSLQRVVSAKVLVIAQAALSLLLVAGSGLFLRTLWNLQAIELGYPKEKLLLVEVDFAAVPDARKQNVTQAAAEKLRQIPTVRAVTYSDRGLFRFDGAFAITVAGFKPPNDDSGGSTGDAVGPGYFSTIGIPILRGREIGWQDGAKSPHVCVINESFANQFFAGRDPIGQKISAGQNDPWRSLEIVGVAKNVRTHSLRGKIDSKFYAAADVASFFEIRTAADPSHILNAARQAIVSVDDDVAVLTTQTLDQLVSSQNAQPRLIAQLCASFGVIALILAGTGIYGVLSHNVARRTNEIGIRMALGADKKRVTGLILRETGFTIAFGLIAGVAAAAALERLIETQLYGPRVAPPRWSLAQYEHVDSAVQLYGLKALDPLTLGIAAVILCAVALIAAYVPAARAARVDPITALRHE